MDNFKAPLLFASTAPDLDRAQHLRKNSLRMSELWDHPGTRILFFYNDDIVFENRNEPISSPDTNELYPLRVLTTSDLTQYLNQLSLPNSRPPLPRSWKEWEPIQRAGKLGFIGQWKRPFNTNDYRTYFALDLSGFLELVNLQVSTLPAASFPRSMRNALGAMLRAPQPITAQVLATARALLMWHTRHPRCSLCGEPSQATEAGWRRTCMNSTCPSTNGKISGPIAGEYPRTDPAVMICVTSPAGGAVLLGRSPTWPRGMYSLIAGFVEPGESAEAAAAREVFEETNVEVDPTSLTYVASQPWPFPGSLMLGYRARAVSGNIQLNDQVC